MNGSLGQMRLLFQRADQNTVERLDSRTEDAAEAEADLLTGAASLGLFSTFAPLEGVTEARYQWEEST